VPWCFLPFLLPLLLFALNLPCRLAAVALLCMLNSDLLLLLSFPLASHQPMHSSRDPHRHPRLPRVSGALDLISDELVHIPRLHIPYTMRSSAPAATYSLADSSEMKPEEQLCPTFHSLQQQPFQCTSDRTNTSLWGPFSGPPQALCGQPQLSRGPPIWGPMSPAPGKIPGKPTPQKPYNANPRHVKDHVNLINRPTYPLLQDTAFHTPPRLWLVTELGIPCPKRALLWPE
jgi:hypothetical protein